MHQTETQTDWTGEVRRCKARMPTANSQIHRAQTKTDWTANSQQLRLTICWKSWRPINHADEEAYAREIMKDENEDRTDRIIHVWHLFDLFKAFSMLPIMIALPEKKQCIDLRKLQPGLGHRDIRTERPPTHRTKIGHSMLLMTCIETYDTWCDTYSTG
jgi:hypothetical protein